MLQVEQCSLDNIQASHTGTRLPQPSGVSRIIPSLNFVEGGSVGPERILPGQQSEKQHVFVHVGFGSSLCVWFIVLLPEQMFSIHAVVLTLRIYMFWVVLRVLC